MQFALSIKNLIKRVRLNYSYIAIIFLLLIVQLFLFSCQKENKPAEEKQSAFEEIPELYIQIMYHNRYGDICFTNYPIQFDPQTIYNNFNEYANIYSFDYLWDFGDGTTDTTRTANHIYDTSGWYNISLTISESQDSIALDTILKLQVYPQIIEQTLATENGKFIYQSENGNYSILYTYNTGFSVDDWYMMEYNKGSIVMKNHLELEMYAEVIDPIINANNNIVLLTDTWFYEFEGTGLLINSNQVWGEYETIQNFNDGYLLTGSTEEEIKLKKLNSSGEITSSHSHQLQIDDYTRTGTSQTFDNEIFIHYLKTEYIDTSYLTDENRPSILQKINNDSTILWQKEYDFSSSTRINKLNDGYLIWGVIYYDGFGEKNQRFSKIDNEGNVIWASTLKINSVYTEYKHAPGLRVFEYNDDLFLFFDNMRCIKYDNSGLVIWDKYYGLENDVFNYASKNTIGNFVLLGSRQFDNEMNGPTLDYNERDLIIIEIDENGDIIPN